MRGDGEAFARRQHIGKRELASVSVDRLRYKRLIGKADNHVAGECGNGRVRAIDLAIGPDRLDTI